MFASRARWTGEGRVDAASTPFGPFFLRENKGSNSDQPVLTIQKVNELYLLLED